MPGTRSACLLYPWMAVAIVARRGLLPCATNGSHSRPCLMTLHAVPNSPRIAKRRLLSGAGLRKRVDSTYTFSAFGNPSEPVGIEEGSGRIGASDQTLALELGEVAVHGLARQPDHFG